MLHCVAGVYYIDASFKGVYADRLEVALIVVNIGVILFAIGLCIIFLLEKKIKAAAVTGLAKAITKLIGSMRLEMRHDVQSLVDALGEAPKVIPPLTAGCRVFHPTNGLGLLTKVDPDDVTGKPFHVRFDSGEHHHYSQESASKKLQPYRDRGGAPENAVLLDEFQQAVRQCLQGSVHISPAALEALFLILNFRDTDQDISAYMSQAWISIELVSFSSTSMRRTL
jgi:hypothetical protein